MTTPHSHERARSDHWDVVFSQRALNEVSWYQVEPVSSLELLAKYASKTLGVIDVGAGSSALVGALVDRHWSDVSALDISPVALDRLREQLGDRCDHVELVRADVCEWAPTRTYGAWHDRAVFHFLTRSGDQERYRDRAAQSLSPGGVAIVAAFAPDGPSHCSSLETVRYDAHELAARFAPQFDLVEAQREEHLAPTGAVQPFNWVVLRRR
jgi:trans-aconitate methyltransferase